MDGYFQIVSNNGFMGIKLVPPTGDGAPINREDILEYLSIKNVVYDVKVLGQALLNLTEATVIPTQSELIYKDTEFVKVSISPDNMSVTVKIYPPFEGGPTMPKEDFMKEFSSRGIVFGFDNAAIDKFLKEKPYCTPVVLVKGQPPVHGTDARIEYFFNTDPKAKPTLNEDGTVDFFNLNTINHCKQGDLLARHIPETMGTPGRNVKGEWIKPRDIKRVLLKFGRNIEQRGEEIYSEVSGHVSLVEGKVFVNNVFTVENVDHSIGNIDYDGSVCINGNVGENFIVRARGSIEVKGVVEGAVLEAGENITIARGMSGMHKGKLKAGGNIVSKFLENVVMVEAGGYVESESIMHSNVNAGTDIVVSGKRGFLAGGHYTATTLIEVKNLGSSMGSDTVVEVGMAVATKAEIQKLQKEKADIDKQFAMIVPVLDGARQKLSQGIKMTTEQLLQIQKLAKLNKDLNDRVAVINEELSGLMGLMDPDKDTAGQIIVRGDVFPGTKICIDDVSMVVKSGMKFCRFIKQAGDVKMVGIY